MLAEQPLLAGRVCNTGARPLWGAYAWVSYFSIRKRVRTLLPREKKGLWKGVLHQERKCICLEGRVGEGDGEVVRWKCPRKLEGRRKVGRFQHNRGK